MIKKFEQERFEFVLYINNNIVCQRYMSIKDFNEQCVSSLDMKELMDSLVGMNNGQYGMLGIIPEYLKKKSMDSLWDNYKPYHTQQASAEGRNIFEKEDFFQFEIKIDKVTVAQSQFPANYFVTDVRYNVNIKDIIPEIKTEIRYFLSQNKCNKKYMDKSL